MADLNVTLPDPMVEFIDGLVQPNGFQDRNAVFEAAIADWQERIQHLNAAIQLGLEDFERGDFIRIDDPKAWIETLGNDED